MDTAARVYVVLMGTIGFLFGQLFFGSFSLEATLTGLGGIVAAMLWRPSWRLHRNIAFSVAALAIIALGGFIVEAYKYYRYFDSPGNNFAWELRAPYLAAILWLAIDASRKLVA